jgi:hypothetical protein
MSALAGDCRGWGPPVQVRAAAWMTPVEIFAPWYSRALAQYMLVQVRCDC